MELWLVSLLLVVGVHGQTCQQWKFDEETQKEMDEKCTDKTLVDDITGKGWFKHDSKSYFEGKCVCADPADPVQTKDCIAVCNLVPDTGANQAWAVSFFFINIVLAITVAILFMSNTGPANTPPYNKAVFALLVFCAVQILISWIGMSPKVAAFPVAAAAVSFALFSIFAAGFVGFGFYRSGAQIM